MFKGKNPKELLKQLFRNPETVVSNSEKDNEEKRTLDKNKKAFIERIYEANYIQNKKNDQVNNN